MIAAPIVLAVPFEIMTSSPRGDDCGLIPHVVLEEA
jgi:hypothetical protein